MIVASFQSQYGLRLSREIHAMPWAEFKSYLVGLSSETPLGRIIAIRSEKDQEILKHFTREQQRIRNEWLARTARRKAVAMSKEEAGKALEQLKQLLIGMAK